MTLAQPTAESSQRSTLDNGEGAITARRVLQPVASNDSAALTEAPKRRGRFPLVPASSSVLTRATRGRLGTAYQRLPPPPPRPLL